MSNTKRSRWKSLFSGPYRKVESAEHLAVLQTAANFLQQAEEEKDSMGSWAGWFQETAKKIGTSASLSVEEKVVAATMLGMEAALLTRGGRRALYDCYKLYHILEGLLS